MKKTLLTIFAVVMLATVNAQVKFGVQAGVNFSTISQNYDDSDNELETKFKVGPRIGVIADIGITDLFSLRPGVFYSSKGFAVDVEEEYDGATSDDSDKSTLNYLEIPVNAVFKFGQIELSAGPYFAVGLGGKNKYEFDGDSDEDDIKFKGALNEDDLNNDDSYLYAYDLGVQLGIGYNLEPVIISASFSKGLGNLSPKFEKDLEEDLEELGYDRSDNKVSNTVLNLSVTFLF